MTGIVAVAVVGMFGLFGFLGFLAFLAYSNNSKNLKNNYLVNENHSICCEKGEHNINIEREDNSCREFRENGVANADASETEKPNNSEKVRVQRVVHCGGIGKQKR